ncbi:MAG TPA: EAL domain-containing protein [Sulfuricurvum sp.]|nr:MAG: diguanylate phosphodiesterase [Campylobacterales bacterium 16-40-21]OZA03898.1 MAG: diguanylate phosphodiesterase [Sulfuricurvum sp. 17-40-25]HQS65577.1 EAL domain-containing protein [Sulfuricurvum sp.]HQT36190.1 EAL domain-containing protein [Sulfuricurvum sp.]
MNIINLSVQKIFNKKHQIFAYELLFKDSSNRDTGLSDSVRGTSQLIMSSITSPELDKLLGKKSLGFVNIDEFTLTKGILDVLDKDRFVLNIHEDIKLDETIVNKIIQYKKRGFMLSLERFDSSAAMINKFKQLFNFIDIIKMDVALSQPENLEKVMKKFEGTRIQLLAQNIETKEDYKKCQDLGFHLFQGYYLDRPDVIEIIGPKEAAQFIILQLIKIIKEDNTANEKLEHFLKKQADLSYKLIQFFNNSEKLNVKVESLTQVINLMGRQKLLRWLMLYLYSELSKNPASKTLLELAIKRAESMEADASPQNKDKAYLAGMFSLLSSIFETNIRELMNHINMDSDITSLVLDKKGIFAGSLMRAEQAEKEYLRKIMIANFDKLYTTDLVNTLECGGIPIDKNKIGDKK